MLALFFPAIVSAENVAGNSASMAYNINKNNKLEDYFIKKMVIKKVLEKYNSPIVESAGSFVDTCVKYELECYLLPSISGLESYFGRFIYPDSNNPFGWGRGLIMFNTWDEAIETVGKGLRENYIDKGAQTIDEIGIIYCEGNTWAGKVKFFVNQFKAEEEKLGLFLGQNQVKL